MLVHDLYEKKTKPKMHACKRYEKTQQAVSKKHINYHRIFRKSLAMFSSSIILGSSRLLETVTSTNWYFINDWDSCQIELAFQIIVSTNAPESSLENKQNSDFR